MTAHLRSPSRFPVATLACALALVAACPGGDEGGAPTRLYLALLGSELRVQLVEEEPEPF